MTKHISRIDFAAAGAPAMIVPAPSARPTTVGRVFDLHPALHMATFAGFFAYLGIMWAAFGEKALLIPFAIFAVFIAAAYIVPASWARIDRRDGPFADWQTFRRDGFDCMTGHLTANETIAQVMIMPAMLLLWGLSVALIRAFV